MNRLTAAAARHRAVAYFALTLTVSWIGALAVALPQLLRHESLPKLTGILMFPVMLLGPFLVGLLLTRIVDGTSGLAALFSRMLVARVSGKWYALLLLPPCLILSVLFLLEKFWSPVFAPNWFLVGVLFSVPAGFVEEIGWTGFAFPALSAQRSAFSAAVLLGLLWGFWHLPVIDFLGTATPHGSYLLRYFLMFVAAMTAMRVLMAWLYTNTGSVLLAQLMHVSSTSSLVLLSPPGVTAQQEALWYGVYAAGLWIVVGLVVLKNGARLIMQPSAIAAGSGAGSRAPGGTPANT